MHILLTRPLEDCSEMILKFQSLGHQVSHLPLLIVKKMNHEEINFYNYGGIIFTSANAINSLDLDKIDKDIICFCVGDMTEKRARMVGFQNTIAAEGSVSNLKELILQNYEIKNKPLLYISGEIISFDLAQQLLNEGYKIKRIINKIDFIFLNKAELLKLTNSSNIILGVKKILKQNKKIKIITTNSKNNVIFGSNEFIKKIKPPSIKVVNENGAGDALAAMMLYLFSINEKMNYILKTSVACGSYYASGKSLKTKSDFLKIKNLSKRVIVQ